MWTVIYMANTCGDAERAREILVKEDFLVKIKPISKSNTEGTYQVLVPRSEAEEANSILMEYGI